MSVSTLAYATRDPVETLEVRVWLSERAATYRSVERRVHEFLARLLAFDHWRVELDRGGVVSVSTEDGARVTTGGEWPAALVAGAVGRRDVEPAADVNLLVTDGQMKRTPTGYGVPHVASVGGARHLQELPPYDELVGDDHANGVDPRIVPLSTPTRTIQVLLHEIGHALGLSHDHGVVFRAGDAVVASPMISTYAFDPAVTLDRSRCGTDYPETADRTRKLSLTFSSCARRALEEYNGVPL